MADWQRPSFDVGDSTIGVFAGDRLVGYAEVTSADRGDAAVHPEFRGVGIGGWLARWMQERARDRGSDVIGMPVPQGSAGDRLLESLGYRVRWTSWVLRLPEGAEIPSRVAAGRLRRTGGDRGGLPSCWNVLEDAFLEWSVRDREPYRGLPGRGAATSGLRAVEPARSSPTPTR